MSESTSRSQHFWSKLSCRDFVGCQLKKMSCFSGIGTQRQIVAEANKIFIVVENKGGEKRNAKVFDTKEEADRHEENIKTTRYGGWQKTYKSVTAAWAAIVNGEIRNLTLKTVCFKMTQKANNDELVELQKIRMPEIKEKAKEHFVKCWQLSKFWLYLKVVTCCK